MPLPSDPALLSSRTIGLYAARRSAVVDAPASDAQVAGASPSGTASSSAGAPSSSTDRAAKRSALADQLGDLFAMVRANKREARQAAREEAKAARDAKVVSATALLLQERARRSD